MRAVVATGHPEVTRIGAAALAAGGNAFDAAVACGFASSVAEPCLTSLGGGGFLLARPAVGQPVLFDFFVDVPGRGRAVGAGRPVLEPVTVRFPASDQVFHVGLGSVAVPGVLRGLLHVHRRLGRLPLTELVAPAVGLAHDGIVVNRTQAHVLQLLGALLMRTAAGRALFAPHGTLLVEGDRFVNRDLAGFLGHVGREGDRELYEGGIARALADAMEAGGGLVTLDDLAAFQVVERAPLAAGYRGLRLLTNPPPSIGGAWLVRALGLLAAAAPGGIGNGFGSSRHVTLLTGLLQELDRADAATAPADDAVRRILLATGGTTHAAVCDAAGNVATMTTSNGEWSGHVAPGTGVMLNNMLGEADLHPDGFHRARPGERVGSMMAPSILLDGDRVRLAFGSGGSTRIRTALLQVLLNVVDFEMGVAEAVAAPRLHWDGARVQCEPGFPESARGALRRRWPLNVWRVTDVYFGGVQAVSPDDGEGGADPRRGGATQVVA
jgi:gamma-glutamyltranspeptidase/glutathione hydrolase